MCMRRLVLAVLVCALPMAAAMACGPDFPQNLLDDRKASLLDLPEGTFEYEAAHLISRPADYLHAVEGSPWEDAAEARAKADAIGLSADELKKVVAMRAAPDLGSATTAGAGLAPELLDYMLGAIAFKSGQMKVAVANFQRVLALSPVDRPRRGLWALYMLGRAQLASGNTDEGFAAYDTVRERALSGAADPLGLAIATYGEQARVHWHRGNIAGAVALYAQQAVHGSRSGRGSLLFVARSVLAHPELLDRALADPLSQRLLTSYFYTRSNELAQDWPLAGTAAAARAEAGDVPDAATRTSMSDPAKSTTSVDLDGFLAAVQRHGLDHLEGADRLAAGAYRAGRYQLAAQFAAKSTTPLAAWVRAKLALRSGDEAVAMREYALAAKGFPVDERWVGESGNGGAVASPLCRVETERGVLALSRGEYLEAMARLYVGAGDHWSDAAYVAERVLTVDELKDFVDRNAHATSRPAVLAADGTTAPSPPLQLRALLARRLLREHRDDEAIAYFDDPVLRKKALALIAARRASNAWTSTVRAEALYNQARLNRTDGMQLLGTELGPDYAVWDGEYAYGEFPLRPSVYVGFAEPGRVKASAPVPSQRFHYRYVAADLDEQAARLLPERSQAYAALMCQATGWMLDTDPRRAAALYHRYLHQGAWVRWGKHFGHDCPPPDFHSASSLPWKQHYWAARHFARRAWPYALAGLAALIVLVVLRRRRRAVA